MTTLRAIVIVLFTFLFSAGAQATVQLQIDANGILTGATGVLVGNNLYNVEFKDGTCVALFGGCDDVSDFVFSTGTDEDNASKALLDFVFLDDATNMFDTKPNMTNGCTFPYHCYALTPFASDALLVWVSSASNNFITTDYVDLFNQYQAVDSSNQADVTWAVWTPVSSSVPEPSTMALLVLGILGAALASRRRAGSQPASANPRSQAIVQRSQRVT
jgi:hypothetical protein